MDGKRVNNNEKHNHFRMVGLIVLIMICPFAYIAVHALQHKTLSDS